MQITTAAGSPPSIQVTGSEVPATGDHTDCTVTLPSLTVALCHHAQLLASCATLSGTGCYLNGATYTLGGDLTTATKDGEIVSYDVANSQATATLEIVQTGSTAPTVTPGSDWEITSPLAGNNPNGGYKTYSVTLSRYLTHDQASA